MFNLKPRLIFLIFLITGVKVWAQFKFSSDVLTQIKRNEVSENDINLGNSIFKLPETQSYFIIRPDMRYSINSFKIVLRPELLAQFEQINDDINSETNRQSESEVDLNDFFVQWDMFRQLSLIAGLQSFQWGPAELLSPSNPIFHFNVNQRTLFYKEKGKVIVRLNFSLDKENSLVALIEPVSNQEPEFVYNDQFTTKGLIKYEKSFSDSSSYFGGVVGFEEQENLFIGSYFNYSFNDQFSSYYDIKIAQYQIHLKPELNGAFVDFIPAFDEKKQWHPLMTFGFRAEGDFDLRIEYIYNSNGYDKDELELAKTSLKQVFNPNYFENLKSFNSLGLEFIGQSYIYTSLRITDFWSLKDINLYSRIFYSLQDSSNLFQIETDKTFGDAWTGLVGGSVANGQKESEFLLTNLWTVSAGLKWSY